MSDPIRNRYVNWVDGMKISKDHFITEQYAIEDRIRDARQLGRAHNDFGLLPGKFNGRSSLEFNLLISQGNQVAVELYQCRAISPAGDRIEILSALNASTVALKAQFNADDLASSDTGDYDLILRVDSFHFSPTGEPSAEESPVRHPYAEPSYSLELVPTSSIRLDANNRNFVPIARINTVAGEFQQDEAFVPPSLSMASCRELEEFYIKYQKFLVDIEQHLFRIITKVNQVAQRSELAELVSGLCHRMLSFIEAEMDKVMLELRYDSPRSFLVHCRGFARCISYGIETLAHIGKDELLAYVQEITDLSPAAYQEVNRTMLSKDMDPYDLFASLKSVLQFCKVNGHLFDELSRLDYIGKKKNTDIYVAEKPVEGGTSEPPKSKSKWDF